MIESGSSSPSPTCVVGVDVGGTKIAAVAVGSGEWDRPAGDHPSLRCPTPDDREALIADTLDLIGRVGRGVPPSRIGLGLAGFIGRDGIARQAPNVPALVGTDLAGAIRSRTGCEVVVDNDANCAAWAARHRDAPDEDHLVVVAIGTGIGGGLIVDGSLVRGAHGFAGEPGHMVVDPSGVACPCGQRGCWETVASGTALDRLADEVIGAGARGAELFERADAGDPAAESALGGYIRWLAVGIANLVNVLDPSSVLISGGIAAQGDALLDRVRPALAALPTVGAGRTVSVRCVSAGPDAAAFGAALLARR